MTITEFLEARIAEDEVFASAPPGILGHNAHLSDPIGTYSPRCPDCVGVHGGERMKSECASKRAIMALHENYIDFTKTPSGNCLACTDSGWEGCLEGASYVEFPCGTVKALAAVYSSHPDYLSEWNL